MGQTTRCSEAHIGLLLTKGYNAVQVAHTLRSECTLEEVASGLKGKEVEVSITVGPNGRRTLKVVCEIDWPGPNPCAELDDWIVDPNLLR